MGIPTLWDDIRRAPNKEGTARVPLTDFTVNKNYKIGIDAHHILFECGFYQFNELGKPILNLMKRLKDLVSLNITFILIFDGSNIPIEKNPNRQVRIPHFMPCVEQLLQLLHISYIVAPGEGEAQCCCFWRQGQIDYVWSNDADCLLFGAFKIWKNYSRNIEDLGVTKVDPLNESKENYITVVDYNKLLAQNRNFLMSRTQLLLYTVLLGSDYHKQGVKKLGPEKSFKLATWKDPNFADMFYDIFISGSNVEDINEKYINLQKKIFQYCKANTAKIFGRNYTNMFDTSLDNFENWPTVSVVNHYFHPLVNEKINLESKFWDINQNINVSNSMAFQLINFNKLKIFLYRFKPPIFKDFNNWFHKTFHEMFLIRYLLNNEFESTLTCKITEEKSTTQRQWKVRYNTFITEIDKTVDLVIVKSPTRSLLQTPIKSPSNSPTSSRSVSPIRTPISSPVKFSSKMLTETPTHFPSRSPKKASKRSPSKRQLDKQEFCHEVWIKQEYLNDDHLLVKQYHERELKMSTESQIDKKKIIPNGGSANSSSKKKKYDQANKIDIFLSRHATPINKNITTLKQLKNPNYIKRIDSIRKKLFLNEFEQDDDEIGDDPLSQVLEESNDSVLMNDDKDVDTRLKNDTNPPPQNEVKTINNDESLVIIEENQIIKNNEDSKIHINRNIVNLIQSSPVKDIRLHLSPQPSSLSDKSIKITKTVKLDNHHKIPPLKATDNKLFNGGPDKRHNINNSIHSTLSREPSTHANFTTVSSNIPSISRGSSSMGTPLPPPPPLQTPGRKPQADVSQSTPNLARSDTFSFSREPSLLDQIAHDGEEFMNNGANDSISTCSTVSDPEPSGRDPEPSGRDLV